MDRQHLIFGVAILVVAYHLWVCVALWRAPEYELRQKWLQTLLVLFIPVLGAVVVHVMLRSERAPPPKRDKDFTREEVGGG